MLNVNGVTFEPASLKVTKHKIWSENTKRTADTTMVGDLLGYKYELEVQYAALSPAQAIAVDAAVSPAFFPVTFIDPATGTEQTKTFYANDPVYPVYSYVFEHITYTNVAVTLIQQ